MSKSLDELDLLLCRKPFQLPKSDGKPARIRAKTQNNINKFGTTTVQIWEI